MHKHSVSFVIPCLNEEQTLAFVLRKINHIKNNDLQDREVEVIVSDNGSTDQSVAIAQSYDARVIHCQQRGYGAALTCGIHAARHEAVVFADADDTYDFLEAPRLIHRLDEGFDMVLGSRLDGTIHEGAMPFLHRYLGTPVLSWLINRLYSNGNYTLSDCNSGFRCFRKEAFMSWNIRGTGMEFASEMLVKAMKSGAILTEVPASLYPDKPGRQPHLRTWRDGMRHLLQIVLEAPELFNAIGSILWLTSWAALFIGLFVGVVNIGRFSLFGIHTMMFALLGSIFGVSVWSIGLFIASKNYSRVTLYQSIIRWQEDRLFWVAGGAGLFFLSLLLGIIVQWGIGGFSNLALERQTLFIISFAANGLLFVANILTAHLIKRL